MKLTDVTVVNYSLLAGLNAPVIRAMAQFVFDELERPQIAWIDLTPAEAQSIAAISSAVERRFLSEQTPVPEEVKHAWGLRRTPARG